jgi:rhamnose transport system permease protein
MVSVLPRAEFDAATIVSAASGIGIPSLPQKIEASRRRAGMPALLRRREMVLAIIVATFLGAIALRAPVFVSPGSLDSLVTDGAILAMMALGQMLAILTRGIDLSVAANVALTGMAMALLSKAHPDMPVYVTIAASLGMGLVLGLFNGALIAFLEMPPIVVTLGTMSIYRGLVFWASDGAWVNAHELGPQFLAFPNERAFGVTQIVWIAALAIAGGSLFLRRLRKGREVYALGGNPAAARYVGIDGMRVRLLVYLTTGALSGLCGYLWVARYAVAYTETALGFEMHTIAACVIGGVSIAGGRGTVAGCLLGTAFLVIIFNALPIIDVSPFWHMAISGTAILVAVIVNSRAEGRRGKLILANRPVAMDLGAREPSWSK